jgi:hypothetical protein
MRIRLQTSVLFWTLRITVSFASIRNRANMLASRALTKQGAMPTQILTSYEAYADAIKDTSRRAIFLGKKHANWVFSHLSMNNLGVQWAQVGVIE